MCVIIFLQYPLGLFDTNENKTDEMIRLLKKLTDLYVPVENDEVVDAVFFGGTGQIYCDILCLLFFFCHIHVLDNTIVPKSDFFYLTPLIY